MMKTLLKISIIFILAIIVSGFLTNPGISQVTKDLSTKNTTFNNPLYTYGPALDNPIFTLKESFENAVFPPAGWLKISPDGGTGWNRQTAGTSPIPGWIGGTITTPPGGGTGTAFATWNTGGAASNSQWLVTPILKNYSDYDSVCFWIRFWPDNFYSDTVDVKISTTSPTIGAFTINVATIVFPRNSADTNWTKYKYRIGDLMTAGSYYYIAFVERVDDNFNDGASVSLDLVSTYSTSELCDPGTPHIEIIDHPDDPLTHLEGQYYYEDVYPGFPDNHYEYTELHCGMNTLKLIDPCNPWVLTFYVKFFEDENDLVKVMKPAFNWDDSICQFIKFEVINQPTWVDSICYWDPSIPYSGMYFDTVIMKVTMTPHPMLGCVPDPDIHPPQPWYGGPGYICENWDTIYNYNCWRDCIGELITFQCIDFCEFPNNAACLMNFDKPLPIELNSFAAIVENENVILNWTTATEKDNAGFNIERKANGIWTNIGYVPGKGNSEVPTEYTFIDNKLNSGSYNYRLKQIDYNGNHVYFDLAGFVNIGIPSKFSLSQNYPNPFNPATKIDFALPYDGNVMMKIYDLSGREILSVINEFRTAGYYTVDFNASNLASGIYYYKITAGNNTAVNKMVVIK